MKYYYVSGDVRWKDYEDSFEHIIEAKNKKLAIKKLEDRFMGFRIEIDTFYETTSNAYIW